jgi:hypothetical protein
MLNKKQLTRIENKGNCLYLLLKYNLFCMDQLRLCKKTIHYAK